MVDVVRDEPIILRKKIEDLRQPTSSRNDLNPQGGSLEAAVVES
jgi:hypothetical protein